MNSLMRSVVFSSITERYSIIPTPVKGDVCFVEDLEDLINFDKLLVYTRYGWQICN